VSPPGIGAVIAQRPKVSWAVTGSIFNTLIRYVVVQNCKPTEEKKMALSVSIV